MNFNEPYCGVIPGVIDIRAKDTIKPWSAGAERANWNEYPWIVKIYNGQQLICTGNLISKSVVLTAGHCFNDGNISHKKLRIISINDKGTFFNIFNCFFQQIHF